MKVKVDTDRCQGHGMCIMICPKAFGHDEDGFGYVQLDQNTVPAELVDDVLLAEIQCPEKAVIVED